jgi:hypothetical protein
MHNITPFLPTDDDDDLLDFGQYPSFLITIFLKLGLLPLCSEQKPTLLGTKVELL